MGLHVSPWLRLLPGILLFWFLCFRFCPHMFLTGPLQASSSLDITAIVHWALKTTTVIYLQIYTHASQTCACACDLMIHRCVCFGADVFVAVGTVSTRHTRQAFVSVVAISSPFWLTKPERSHSAVASCAGNVLLLAPPVRLCTLGDSLQPRNRSIILQECWLTADSRGHYTYAMHCACHSVGKPR